MSDLHGFQPAVPDADLLIIAGDVCLDRVRGMDAVRYPELQAAWFDATIRPWIRSLKTPTVLTWGNHDFCGELKGYIGKSGTHLRIVVDELVTIAGLRIWMTPWSNQFMRWAWMKPPLSLLPYYARIPEGLDVLVSHQPPYGCGDRYPNLQTGKYEHIGSQELRDAIRRVRPQVVICGHLHDGHGVYDIEGIPVYNVSVVNDAYQLVHPVTVITVEPRKGERHGIVEPATLPGHRPRD
jgi:Icc-related predicted phosphoesterase